MITELHITPVAIIRVDTDGPVEGYGSISSRNLYAAIETKNAAKFNAAMEAVELMVLNDACRGTNINTSRYLEDLQQVVRDLGEKYPSPETLEMLSGMPEPILKD